ncbi:SDR family NAD(P)-dependent oxidoreductase [Massilia cavernae]|uniref:SDR family oxidoreductase n=1 Tax=Massilia cavernae TaxID=2320864 RepID=A0A418Y6G0_9BURK|nr:SDR family oxidoreductase [Massilia cavernae]RJG23482.1 SDR family oxidoreductase [Massilia cavernae]
MSSEDFPSGIAFVAGGSGGIGGAIVEAFARAGSDVVFTYRNGAERAEQVRARASAHGVKVEARQVLLEEPATLTAALDQVAASGRPIHSFVYASGPRIKVGYVSDLEVEDWRFALSHDSEACFTFAKAAIAFLKAHPAGADSAGSITAITSSQRFKPEVRGVLSAAPKAAIEALFMAIAKENARFGIRANIIQSGWVAAGQIGDGMEGQLNGEAMKSILGQIPMRRLGSPKEVAEGALFVSSARASFVTGATLVIDGGMHL